MQIVIDLDEGLIKGIKGTDFVHARRAVKNFQVTIASAIRKGTVLPDHGRLIDVDNIQEIELEDSLHILTHKKGDEVDWYIDAPTILEAWGNEE